MSGKEVSLFRMISTLLSIEFRAVCVYSEPPVFGFKSYDGDKKTAIQMMFAHVDNGEVVIEGSSQEIKPFVHHVCVFLRKRKKGDNLFVIPRGEIKEFRMPAMRFAHIIETKFRVNVSQL